MKLLLVEDDVSVRTALSRLLKQGGHDVVQAFTAESAMQLLQHERGIDVVLLDILLGPHGALTGWAVAGYMQAHAHTRDVPIIVISGIEPDEIRRGAMQYGNLLASAAVILGKPVDGDVLLATIAKLHRSLDDEPPDAA